MRHLDFTFRSEVFCMIAVMRAGIVFLVCFEKNLC